MTFAVASLIKRLNRLGITKVERQVALSHLVSEVPHRSSPRRPVTRSAPPLHALRSQAPTGRATQLSSRPARRELENPGNADESVHAIAACSRIRGPSITNRYRYLSHEPRSDCAPGAPYARPKGK
jgi:hypothetical protein